MKKTIYTALLCVLCAIHAGAQDRTVQNRPYTDLRQFHFGIFVGTHLQDLEFTNIGPQQVTLEDGTVVEKTISTDQNRWDPGFTVGVLGELRLNSTLQFRIAPSLYFGTRQITFRNITDLDANGNPTEQRQEMKTVYVSSALDLICAAPRFNNHRPYVMLGLNPMINLSGKDDDIIKLKRFDAFLEVGVGCDFYLPFFKLRPELKFMYGLTNSLDSKHPDKIKNAEMRPYATSVSDARSKIIALTFYFE